MQGAFPSNPQLLQTEKAKISASIARLAGQQKEEKEDSFTRALNYKDNGSPQTDDELSLEDQPANEKELPMDLIVNKEREKKDGKESVLLAKEIVLEAEKPKNRATFHRAGSVLQEKPKASVMAGAAAEPMEGKGDSSRQLQLAKAMSPAVAGAVIGLLIFTVLYLIY